MKKYYIYKLTVRKTKHFYVGATVNMDVRLRAHLANMRASIFALTTYKYPKDYYYRGFMVPAKEFLKKTRRKPFQKIEFLKSDFLLEILSIAGTVQDAAVIENRCIVQNINNPMCFNSQERSHYKERHSSTLIKVN